MSKKLNHNKSKGCYNHTPHSTNDNKRRREKKSRDNVTHKKKKKKKKKIDKNKQINVRETYRPGASFTKQFSSYKLRKFNVK